MGGSLRGGHLRGPASCYREWFFPSGRREESPVSLRKGTVIAAGFAVAWEVKGGEEDGLASSGRARHFAQDLKAGLRQ